jgi:hypothetical protein
MPKRVKGDPAEGICSIKIKIQWKIFLIAISFERVACNSVLKLRVQFEEAKIEWKFARTQTALHWFYWILTGITLTNLFWWFKIYLLGSVEQGSIWNRLFESLFVLSVLTQESDYWAAMNVVKFYKTNYTVLLRQRWTAKDPQRRAARWAFI